MHTVSHTQLSGGYPKEIYSLIGARMLNNTWGHDIYLDLTEAISKKPGESLLSAQPPKTTALRPKTTRECPLLRDKKQKKEEGGGRRQAG
jgi:hypothetical protein